MGHFFDNMLLLAILYLVGFILFLAAYLTLKDFSGQPPVKKDKSSRFFFLPPTERRGAGPPPY